MASMMGIPARDEAEAAEAVLLSAGSPPYPPPFSNIGITGKDIVALIPSSLNFHTFSLAVASLDTVLRGRHILSPW